jgi:hypothetical protein
MERDQSRENRCVNQPLTIDELVSIYRLMQLMLHEAESGDWQALSLLDAQRRQLIDQNAKSEFSNHVQARPMATSVNQDKLAYDIQCNEILQLDKKITETVKNAKQQLVEKNRNIKNQVVAKNGYAKTASINTSFFNQR